jgi:hypothetical protein
VSIPDLYLAIRLQIEPLIAARRAWLLEAKGVQLAEPTPRDVRNAVVIMLAQMALETNRFKSIQNYNLGGIKCPKGWTECYQHFATREHFAREIAERYIREAPPGTTVEHVDDDDDGKWILVFRGPHPMNRFVAFESLEGAVAHHCGFMIGRLAENATTGRPEWKNARYVDAVERALQNDALGFVTELREKGYFTADPKVYSKSVTSLAREYERAIPADAPTLEPKPPAPVVELVSVAASAPAPQGKPIDAPVAPSPPPVDAPAQTAATAPQTLPRIGNPAPLARVPWFLRLFGLLARLFVRRPMP